VARIVLIGEAMIELSQREGRWHLGYGGDTLNTAIHLAREGHEVAYLTALGDDPFSASMRQSLEAEGLDTRMVLTHPVKTVGLYAIQTDPFGERNFTYWREASAARALFELPEIDDALAQAEQADLVVFSLISLAVLSPAGRERLLELARKVRARGAHVAFDGNYRPRLWSNWADAKIARDAAIATATIGLPTLEDETQLSGEPHADAVAAHWHGLGCAECVVKLGAQGCRLPNGDLIAPDSVVTPVDTSGAGDAFNAGYLSARLNGRNQAEAAQAGHVKARWTIMRPGAIPALES
jgi:2-dehydro-3-deoxygluconokinase